MNIQLPITTATLYQLLTGKMPTSDIPNIYPSMLISTASSLQLACSIDKDDNNIITKEELETTANEAIKKNRQLATPDENPHVLTFNPLNLDSSILALGSTVAVISLGLLGGGVAVMWGAGLSLSSSSLSMVALGTFSGLAGLNGMSILSGSIINNPTFGLPEAYRKQLLLLIGNSSCKMK